MNRKTALMTAYDAKLCGGVNVIHFEGERLNEEDWDADTLYSAKEPVYQPVMLKAVPYACWGNRQSGEMLVWMHAKD